MCFVRLYCTKSATRGSWDVATGCCDEGLRGFAGRDVPGETFVRMDRFDAVLRDGEICQHSRRGARREDSARELYYRDVGRESRTVAVCSTAYVSMAARPPIYAYRCETDYLPGPTDLPCSPVVRHGLSLPWLSAPRSTRFSTTSSARHGRFLSSTAALAFSTGGG